MSKDTTALVCGPEGRQALWFPSAPLRTGLGAEGISGSQILMEDLAAEEEQGAKGLRFWVEQFDFFRILDYNMFSW